MQDRSIPSGGLPSSCAGMHPVSLSTQGALTAVRTSLLVRPEQRGGGRRSGVPVPRNWVHSCTPVRGARVTGGAAAVSEGAGRGVRTCDGSPGTRALCGSRLVSYVRESGTGELVTANPDGAGTGSGVARDVGTRFVARAPADPVSSFHRSSTIGVRVHRWALLDCSTGPPWSGIGG